MINPASDPLDRKYPTSISRASIGRLQLLIVLKIRRWQELALSSWQKL